jgi:hypothetical protein
MGTDHALHQRLDHGRSPGCQFAGFQMHVQLTAQVSEGLFQIQFTGAEAAIHSRRASARDGYLMKRTRPKIESDINYAHADVSSLKQVLEKAG